MPSRAAIFAVIVVAVVLTVALGGPAVDTPDESASIEPEATVTVTAANGTTLGMVRVAVADTHEEQYQGLSNTEALSPDTGMLFVYAEEAERTFVMREMNYPIDMVFIGADRTITTIHHAETEANDGPDDDLTTYTGRGQWVLEVPYNWTTEHGVEPGAEITITYD